MPDFSLKQLAWHDSGNAPHHKNFWLFLFHSIHPF